MGCKIKNMDSTYTTIVKNDGDWWIGWIEEVPGVNAQERSKAALVQSLRRILHEALEFNRPAAQGEWRRGNPWRGRSEG